MTKSMTRGKLRAILYALSLIIVLSVFAIINTTKAKAFEHQYLISQERSVGELGEYISNLETDLQKGVYANTPPMLASLSTQLLRDAGGAKSALSQINISGIELDNTYKFLSQVGNFTSTLSKKAANGEEIKEKERKELLSLLNYANVVSESITQLRDDIDVGKISAAQITSINKEDTKSSKEVASLSQSFNNIEQTLVDYPTLIYDGPFSDHLLNKESAFLKDKKDISEAEAKKRALEYCKNVKEFKKTTTENGNIVSYIFSNDSTTVAISRQGGYLCYIIDSRSGGKAKYNDKQALDIANKYLETIGVKNMKPSYSMTEGGVCTINFAYTTQNVVCYTDLIKVSVDLNNGKIVSYDARGYLMNHKDRKFGTPKLSQSEAQKNLSHALKVQSVKLANIPTDDGREVYCYEFKCKGIRDDDVLVYINSETGEEEQILMLIKNENGTLTK